MRRYRIFAAVVLALFIGSLASADSIWDRRDPRAAYIYHDNRARNVGDVLTIAISENTATNEREQRALDRQSRNNAAINFDGSYNFAGGNDSTGKLASTASTDTRRRFNGSAQMSSNRTFVDRMAVTIVDVLPNGNLVFEGYRTRVVAGEERQLRMTGVVRQADIGSANTIQSQFIANLRISYVGRGMESEYTNQSFIGRVINYIWP